MHSAWILPKWFIIPIYYFTTFKYVLTVNTFHLFSYLKDCPIGKRICLLCALKSIWFHLNISDLFFFRMLKCFPKVYRCLLDCIIMSTVFTFEAFSWLKEPSVKRLDKSDWSGERKSHLWDERQVFRSEWASIESKRAKKCLAILFPSFWMHFVQLVKIENIVP